MSPERTRHRTYTVVAAMGLLAGLGAVALWGQPLAVALGECLDVLGPWSPVAFTLATAVLALVGVPRALLTATGAILLGPWLAAALAWLASLMAASAGYAIGRALSSPDRPVPARQSSWTRARDLLVGGGRWTILVARVSPVPFWAVNFGAGMLRFRWSPYVWGSALGLVPSAVTYAAAGGLLDSVWTFR